MTFLRAVGACFFLAGAASAVLDAKLRGMGVAWVVTGALVLGIGQVFVAAAARERRLLEHGAPGRATVLQVSDTGITVNKAPRVRVRVRIEPASGQAFEATTAMLVSRVSIPRIGEVFQVRFDPKSPNDFVFDGRTAHGAPAAPPPPSGAPVDTIGQLERLTRLRDAGALTPDEFEAQKRKLLA